MVTNLQAQRSTVARPMLAIRSIAWITDQETGYQIPRQDANFRELLGAKALAVGDDRLEWDGLTLGWAFTPSRKKEFVLILPKHWPNITAACDEVGITRQTYTAHLAIDEKFRDDVQAVVDRKVDEVEQRFFEFGKRPKNYLDRITIARAYRGEIYNPRGTLDVNVQGRVEMSDAEAGEIARRAGQVVDAEIVREQYWRKPPQIPGAVGLEADPRPANRKDVPADGDAP